MTKQPNILILMCDQLQGRVFEPGHPCPTPNLDRLIQRGVRTQHAYTPNAICSPARASMMTGKLPHNHGVLTVTHCVDPDQSRLRTDLPHFAQRLQEIGYHTGYFGKWHVDHAITPNQVGWTVDMHMASECKAYQDFIKDYHADLPPLKTVLEYTVDGPEGWPPNPLYRVVDQPADKRPGTLGSMTRAAGVFLDDAMRGDQPWCCMVSLTEPHDAFVCGQRAYEMFDPDQLPMPENWRDRGNDKPAIYRKAARAYDPMTDRQRREAAACYYALIHEIDEQFGKLLDQIEHAGQTDNTIVVLTSDHGEMLGAHGLYCKNFGAFEETYHIPMIIAPAPGTPGSTTGVSINARVGLHDLAPTLLELAGAEPIGSPDSRSFAPLLKDPEAHQADWQTGYAEYFGTRHCLTQRIAWDGDWKLVWNGFAEDELYNLADDPGEIQNLAELPQHHDRLRHMMRLIWQRIKETNDHTLLNSGYTGIRAAATFGPAIANP